MDTKQIHIKFDLNELSDEAVEELSGSTKLPDELPDISFIDSWYPDAADAIHSYRLIETVSEPKVVDGKLEGHPVYVIRFEILGEPDLDQFLEDLEGVEAICILDDGTTLTWTGAASLLTE